jgi:drug/metabolite transporter (DMT)-like permease
MKLGLWPGREQNRVSLHGLPCSGAALGIASAVLFGASTPLAKLLLGAVDPWLLAGLLYLGSGIGLGIAHMARRALGLAPPEAPLRRAAWPWLAAVILAGGVVGPLLLMAGLSVTPASSAALLLNLEGLATMGIAWVVFREHADRRIVFGALLILSGAVLLSWQGKAETMGWGAFAIAGACLAWGTDNNLTRKLSAADPVQIAMLKGLAAGVMNLVLALAHGAAFPPLAPLLGGALVGFFGYGVSLALFVLALRHLGAARTGAYFSTAPFIGAILALPLFGESLSLRLLAAAALMGAGLWLHLAEHHEHEHVHEELVHEHAHVHDAHHQHVHAPEDPPGEPHVHSHRHAPTMHRHPHYPDLHHRHPHAV